MKYFPADKPDAAHVGYQQQVKESNIKHVFDLVRSGKCRSRAEIVREMALSATSVSVLVDELSSRKLIDETGPIHTAMPGRRPISLTLNRRAHNLAVFSITAQGVRFALMDLECHILEHVFLPLEVSGMDDASASDACMQLLDDILHSHSRLFNPSRTLVIGVSFPGIYIEEDHMFHTQWALGFHLLEDPVRRFQKRSGLPVFLLNGTRSMAYAEKKYLDAVNNHAPETRDMVFIKIRKGIKCAIIAHGDMYPGPFNMSGEVGHFTIDYQGKPCYCGSAGCLERYADLDAILEDARQAAREAEIAPVDDMEALARRYTEEPVLLNVVRRSAQLLAAGLYGILCSSGIRHLVLGGGIEILGETFLQEVYHALMRRAMLVRRLELSYAHNNEDAELVGLAEYFLDKVYSITM